MKWSGFRLTTVSVFSPFLIFITVSLVSPPHCSVLFVGIFYFFFAVVFFFVWFFLFFVPFLVFCFVFLPLCVLCILFSGDICFSAPPTFWGLFGFVVYVDCWLGFLLVCQCMWCWGWPFSAGAAWPRVFVGGLGFSRLA